MALTGPIAADGPTQPSGCRHAPQLPELLAKRRCSLLVSTPDQTVWGAEAEGRMEGRGR